MDRQTFKKFCDEWLARGAIDFTRKSHFEEMSPLLEPHAEVVTVQKNEFHALPGNVYYPRKETSDKLGKAAGISFSGAVRIEKQGDGAWVGTAYPQELGPDGKMVVWAPASYEFNPADRAEEELLRKAIKDRAEPPTEVQIKLKTLEYKKVALRRADTGARAAAIISAIGMPTGFKDLFSQNEPFEAERHFLFSRVVVNTKNELVLNRALDSMFGATALLSGPANATQAIAAPVAQGDDGDFEEEPRDVTPGSEDPYAGASDAFGDPNGVNTPRGKVKNVLDRYSQLLSERGRAKLTAALAASDTPDETFNHLYGQAFDYLAGRGVKIAP